MKPTTEKKKKKKKIMRVRLKGNNRIYFCVIQAKKKEKTLRKIQWHINRNTQTYTDRKKWLHTRHSNTLNYITLAKPRKGKKRHKKHRITLFRYSDKGLWSSKKNIKKILRIDDDNAFTKKAVICVKLERWKKIRIEKKRALMTISLELDMNDVHSI